MFFALYVYNESVMIIAYRTMFLFILTFNVNSHLNIKSVVLKLCNGMMPIYVT